jgi:HPt (histidine-containing phosphotransfer) domain-containing protein
MIDWSQVAQLRREVGAKDFDEVLDLFFEEVEEGIARLPALAQSLQLGEDLHALKGSALNLGFSVFAEACHKGELLCAKKGAEGVDIPAILSTYSESKQAFYTELPTAFTQEDQTNL